MNLTAFCLGLGTLLVAVALKYIPEEKNNKITSYIVINEDPAEDDHSIIGQMQRKVAGKIKKSETDRMLDSQ